MLAAYRFADKVGVAPSTTTMIMNGRSRRRRVGYNPYASLYDMRGGLGVASEAAPYRTGRAYGQTGTTAFAYNQGQTHLLGTGIGQVGVVSPIDAWATGDEYSHEAAPAELNLRRSASGRYSVSLMGLGITSGEINRSLSGLHLENMMPGEFVPASMRALAGLGEIPNDDDKGRIYGYTPVHSGWIHGKHPDGRPYYVDGLYGPAAVVAEGDPAAVATLVTIQRRQMIMQGITTVAIVGLASAAMWNAFKPTRRRKLKCKR